MIGFGSDRIHAVLSKLKELQQNSDAAIPLCEGSSRNLAPQGILR